MGGCKEEKRGDRRRNRTAITIQDYVACCSPQASSTGCASRFRVWEGKRARGNPIGGAENIHPSHPEGSEQRPQHPRPPSLCPRIAGPPLPGEGKRLRSSCSMLVFSSRYRSVRVHISMMIRYYEDLSSRVMILTVH